MAFAENTIQGRVVKNGGPISDNVYISDASTKYKFGMLLEKTVAGAVSPATEDHATNGIHAMYVGPNYPESGSAPAATVKLAVMDILPETRFLAQVYHGTETSAVLSQGLIGDVYGIQVASAANLYVWSVDIGTSVSNNGDIIITDIWDNPFWYNSGHNSSGVNGIIECRIRQARLDLNPT